MEFGILRIGGSTESSKLRSLCPTVMLSDVDEKVSGATGLLRIMAEWPCSPGASHQREDLLTTVMNQLSHA